MDAKQKKLLILKKEFFIASPALFRYAQIVLIKVNLFGKMYKLKKNNND